VEKLEVERLAIAIGSQEAIYCRRHGSGVLFFKKPKQG